MPLTSPEATRSSKLSPFQKNQSKPKVKGRVLQNQKPQVRKKISATGYFFILKWRSHLLSFSRLLKLLAEIFPTKIQYKHRPSKWTVLCLLLLPWVSARDDAGKRSAPSTVWAAAGKQQRNSVFAVLMWSYQNVLSDFFHPYPQRHFSVSQGITDGRPESAVLLRQCSIFLYSNLLTVFAVKPTFKYLYLFLCESEK